MLELKNIYKTYSSKNGVTHRALENVSLKFADKGLVFILGKSGSGKSTLLNIIGGLDNFDRGEILVNGTAMSSFKNEEYNSYRNTYVGFIFQDFCLIDTLTAQQNVALALDLQNNHDYKDVDAALKEVDAYSFKNKKAYKLSGGQKQRVAIARAVIKNPGIILADEPTGSLDEENSKMVVKLLKKLSQERLVVVVTHNRELAMENADRIIEIRDGFVLKDIALNQKITEVSKKPMLFSSSLIRVPAKAKLNEENMEAINSILSEQRKDYFLMFEKDSKRVMSMYPNLKEVIDSQQEDEKTIPYELDVDEINITKNNHVKKVNSHLPLLKGIKIGFSLLAKRKGKLLISIILSLISVVLIGVASSFSQYSMEKAISMSVNKDNVPYLDVTSSFSLSNPEYKLQDSEIAQLNDLKAPIAKKYDISLGYVNNSLGSAFSNDGLFNGTFYGFIVTDSFEDFGFHYLAETSLEENKDGLIISSIVAKTIIKYSSSVSSYEDIVSNTIKIGNFTYPVKAIFDANYDKYAELSSSASSNVTLANEYASYAQSLYLRLIVSTTFFDQYLNNITVDSKVRSYTTSNTDIAVYASRLFKLNSIKLNATTTNIDYIGIQESEVADLKENQVLLATQALQKVIGIKYDADERDKIIEAIQKYNESHKSLRIQNSTGDEIYYGIDDVEIVGVIISYASDSTKQGIYVSDASFNKMVQAKYKPSKLMLGLQENANHSSIIHYLYSNGFTVDNEFVTYFRDFASTISQFSTIINIATIVWIAFVAMLLYSFMAGSIKENRKSIGILKALGAKASDIFKIFIIEALIIGLTSSILGIFIYYYGGLLINNLITNYYYTFYFPIFIFSIYSVLLMIVSTFLILTVALIIPITRVSNINPIEVMNRQ